MNAASFFSSRRRPFSERVIRDLLRALERAHTADRLDGHQGLLQTLDPRTKLIITVLLIVSSVMTHSLTALISLFAATIAIAAASRIQIRELFPRTWAGVLLFTGVVALPALVLVPGDRLWALPFLDWTVSYQGLRSAAFLIGRAETSATLALLLIATTPWTHVLKALRCLGVPVALVAVLGMTHRYIFLLLQNTVQLFDARRSRLVARTSAAGERHMAIATAGALLGKTFHLSSEVHLAMIARGYCGETHVLDEFHTRLRDRVALLLVIPVPLMILWFQR